MSDNTENVAKRNRDYIMQKANVVGIAGGDDKVLVLVRAKKPLSELSEYDVVPRELEGETTDVMEVGDIEPMQVGSSIGLSNGGTGTFGAVVQDDFRTYILTNNHVAAASNNAFVLSEIHSPGQADGLGGVIGRLARFEPIFFDKENYIDAALIETDREKVQDAIGHFPEYYFTAVTGWTLQKRGRTSGHTWGEVMGRGATVNVNYGEQGVATFEDQMISTPILEPGDSGSVIATLNGYACALGFAGSSRVSVHNPINTVFDALAVRLTQ